MACEQRRDGQAIGRIANLGAGEVAERGKKSGKYPGWSDSPGSIIPGNQAMHGILTMFGVFILGYLAVRGI